MWGSVYIWTPHCHKGGGGGQDPRTLTGSPPLVNSYYIDYIFGLPLSQLLYSLRQWRILAYWLRPLCSLYFQIQTSNSSVKPWAKSMGEGDFRPSTAPRPLDRFSWNFKYITNSPTRPRTQNFRGLCRRGWSEQIASLTHERFFFCLFLHRGHRSHLWTNPAHNTSLYVVLAKVMPFGGLKDEI